MIMFSWDTFIYFSILSLLFWVSGAIAAWGERSKLALTLSIGGLIVFFGYILNLWILLERPPLRTMGETRLWYSFFLALAGVIIYSRWKYKWILSFSTIMAGVFIMINLLKPEIHDKTLMPALQSPWFAPHVIVYMFAYALLGAATLVAIYSLLKKTVLSTEMPLINNLINSGVAFLTFGMLFGALWAKEAWGHYWSWDPKETWAAITWLGYMVYLHYSLMPRQNRRVAMWMIIVCFVLLQMCWWGINYLPSAQATSVHTYTS